MNIKELTKVAWTCTDGSGNEVPMEKIARAVATVVLEAAAKAVCRGCAGGHPFAMSHKNRHHVPDARDSKSHVLEVCNAMPIRALLEEVARG